MKLDIQFLDCVGDISALVGEGPGSIHDDTIVWYHKNHEIHVDWKEKTFGWYEVASSRETVSIEEHPSKKEYFAFMGVAEFYKLKFEDGYIDYGSEED